MSYYTLHDYVCPEQYYWTIKRFYENDKRQTDKFLKNLFRHDGPFLLNDPSSVTGKKAANNTYCASKKAVNEQDKTLR